MLWPFLGSAGDVDVSFRSWQCNSRRPAGNGETMVAAAGEGGIAKERSLQHENKLMKSSGDRIRDFGS